MNTITTAVQTQSLALSIEGLSKQYNTKNWGLRDFTLNLGQGILGLLGPNGAGKSTFMRILATITKPTAGRATWNGSDIAKSPDELRAVMGYLPQDFGVYPNLNVIEFLEYLAAIKGLDGRVTGRRIDELLEVVNLTDARKRSLGSYSGGMIQRVGIAQALLNRRAGALSQPTLGSVWRTDRHSVNSHRLGCGGDSQRHCHHQQRPTAHAHRTGSLAPISRG
jgi:ABC-type multidrug transport system ATPase subunit